MSYVNYELVHYDSISRDTTPEELYEENVKIVQTQDIEFINFVNLYRALNNLRTKYAGMDILLMHIPPHLNT